MAETDLSQNMAAAPPPGDATAEAMRLAPPWLESLLGIIGLILRRLAFGLLILLSIIFFSYFGIDMARGASFGEAVVSAIPDTVEYVGRLLTGEMGTTTAGTGSLMGIPVSQVIAERLPRSLALLGISLGSATLLGVMIGVRAARRRSKRSLAMLMATIIGISVPSFFGAFLLQWAVITFTQKTGQSLIPVGGFGWDAHLILPVLVLAARPLAQITRITHSTVSDVSQRDFVRTARSKGLRQPQITNVHVMRNAAIPILTTVGVSLHFALSSLPIVEVYFGLPGIGFTLLGAIARQDDELAIALLLCIGILVILVNIILEVSYRLIDPRVSETPSYLARGRGQGAREAIKGALADLGDYLTDNPVTNWFRSRLARRTPAVESSPAIGPTVLTGGAGTEQIMPKSRLWPSVWNNFPLVVGGLLVLALVVIVFFGSYLSPHDPYATRGLELVEGKIIVPPFAPSEEFSLGTDVLGRDMLSLLFTGAQLTLTLVLLSVLARMGVGILTGAVAGWAAGSSLDRIIMGLAEMIAAFPALLLTMILILALGIRQGMWPFIVAMTFVGWGDTMQYVRGEVVGIRPKSFIESAVAIGARTPRIVGRHILPNLLAPLISIFALEMGAVLMLLGELGFLSIFIGGGAFIELDWNSPPVHYSDVPEWGALLSTIRVHARAFPWLAVFPTVAFFLAILGFNLFGEGVRRLVEDGSLIINRVVNRYTVLALILAGIAFAWFRSNSGTIAFNRQHALAFSGEEAMSYVADLSDPEMDGRALGTDGLDVAAAYVAEQFEALGLQPAGSQFTYFQERFRSYAQMEAVPQLSVGDGGPEPVFQEDYAYYPAGRFMSDGEMSGAVRFVGLGESASTGRFGASAAFHDLRFADYSDEIILVLSDRDANILSFIPRGGMLVVGDDPVNLRRHFTQPGRSRATPDPISGRVREGDTPSMWISEEMANRILVPTGQTISDFRESIDDLDIGGMIEVPTGTQVSMQAQGTLVERLPVQNVIGHLPGNSSADLETKLDHEMIVVLAQYDSPAPGPEEAFNSAANDNASGVAVMLEAIRVLQETEYRPNRTFLFVAYSGEGLEGGESVLNPNVERFLQAKVGFATSFDLEAIIHLRGLGAGDGDRLEVSSGGSYRLAELFETAGRLVGVDVVRSDEPIDISVIFDEGSPSQSAQDAPEVRLSWQGWSEHARTPADTPEQVSGENLEKAGRTLALALMQIGQERQY